MRLVEMCFRLWTLNAFVCSSLTDGWLIGCEPRLLARLFCVKLFVCKVAGLFETDDISIDFIVTIAYSIYLLYVKQVSLMVWNIMVL